MIEVKDNKLFIDGKSIGDENRILTICEKAVKYDELKATFENGGDA